MGFKNLVKLSSIAFLEGFYYHPRIDREVLAAHSEGLICLSGCLAGEFNQHLLKDDRKAAEKLAGWFAKTFKKDFYIELQNNGHRSCKTCCTPVAVDIAQKIGVPLVATADAHYLCARTTPIAHDVLFCISTGKEHEPAEEGQYPEEKMPNPYYVRSRRSDMYELFPGHEAAVAMQPGDCRRRRYPDRLQEARHFPVFQPPGRSSPPTKYLKRTLPRAASSRPLRRESEASGVRAARPRTRHHLEDGLFAAYFLIVWDFVRYALERGHPQHGAGFSGCGAIVVVRLETQSHVCPLEYDLLFERFLDPSRSEPPDIDIDFCQDRRELVIQYVKDKYGRDSSVAQIGTFGTLGGEGGAQGRRSGA